MRKNKYLWSTAFKNDLVAWKTHDNIQARDTICEALLPYVEKVCNQYVSRRKMYFDDIVQDIMLWLLMKRGLDNIRTDGGVRSIIHIRIRQRVKTQLKKIGRLADKEDKLATLDDVADEKDRSLSVLIADFARVYGLSEKEQEVFEYVVDGINNYRSKVFYGVYNNIADHFDISWDWAHKIMMSIKKRIANRHDKHGLPNFGTLDDQYTALGLLLGPGNAPIFYREIHNLFNNFLKRSRWVNKNTLLVGDLERYEQAVKEEWDLLFDILEDECTPEIVAQEKEHTINSITRWVERDHLSPLADEGLEAKWFPEFKDILISILKG
jgi:hypothetical protein